MNRSTRRRFWQTEYFMPLGQEGQGGREDRRGQCFAEGGISANFRRAALVVHSSSHASIVMTRRRMAGDGEEEDTRDDLLGEKEEWRQVARKFRPVASG